uniref:Uncharacterized protein n=1 Tax=Salix viminalis TaxID=40686 RepID=A0A6N2K1R6_SALVM
MFDLKSFTWLPLHCTGTGPSPRSNHVAALYDDKNLLIFGGTSKSRTLNDLYSLDFETMVWSRTKIRGFHPSPRAGCCGVLCGTKWYIAGGGTRKKRHSETLIYDITENGVVSGICITPIFYHYQQAWYLCSIRKRISLLLLVEVKKSHQIRLK